MLSRMTRNLRRALSSGRSAPRPPVLGLEQLEAREVPAVVYGLTTTNVLVRFDSASPGTILGSVAITGLQTGTERVLGIDFRPRTGQLIATTAPAGSTAAAVLRTYYVNPLTGVATFIGAVPST